MCWVGKTCLVQTTEREKRKVTPQTGGVPDPGPVRPRIGLCPSLGMWVQGVSPQNLHLLVRAENSSAPSDPRRIPTRRVHFGLHVYVYKCAWCTHIHTYAHPPHTEKHLFKHTCLCTHSLAPFAILIGRQNAGEQIQTANVMFRG